MIEEQPNAPRRNRVLWLAFYYFLILLGVIAVHATGSFSTPSFVYQGF